MARLEKNNADYFPFYCKEGKAMYLIEAKYGNDGFACWIKILRLLTVTNFHHIDMNPRSEALFVVAKCGVTEERLLAIINDLCDMGEIDTELWTSHRIIWSDKLVESIKDAYARRTNTLITRDKVLAKYSKSTPVVMTEKKNDSMKPKKIRSPKSPRTTAVRKAPAKVGSNKPAKTGPDYIDGILRLWCQKYQEHRGHEYEVVNPGKERMACAKLSQLNKKKFPGLNTEQAMEKLASTFSVCLSVEAPWYWHNMSPSIIISKFNEIKSYVTGSQKNLRGNGKIGVTDDQFDEILSRVFDAGPVPNSHGGNDI